MQAELSEPKSGDDRTFIITSPYVGTTPHVDVWRNPLDFPKFENAPPVPTNSVTSFSKPDHTQKYNVDDSVATASSPIVFTPDNTKPFTQQFPRVVVNGNDAQIPASTPTIDLGPPKLQGLPAPPTPAPMNAAATTPSNQQTNHNSAGRLHPNLMSESTINNVSMWPAAPTTRPIMMQTHQQGLKLLPVNAMPYGAPFPAANFQGQGHGTDAKANVVAQQFTVQYFSKLVSSNLIQDSWPGICPGIALSPIVYPRFVAMVSIPRPLYCVQPHRLLLLSSRVNNINQVINSALPSVAVVAYNWNKATLRELILNSRKALNNCKVLSIAMCAPGHKPGCVDLLMSHLVTHDTLATRQDLLQFFRDLSSMVMRSSSVVDDRHIDFIGCRVTERPREGAALLKELWKDTGVAYAASDDAMQHYTLCNVMEYIQTQDITLVPTTVEALPLYWDPRALLQIGPSGYVHGAVATAN